MTTDTADAEVLRECLARYARLPLAVDREAPGSAAAALTAALRIGDGVWLVPVRRVAALVRQPRLVAVPGTPAWMPCALQVGQRMVAAVCGRWAIDDDPQAVAIAGPPAVAVVLDLGEMRLAVLVDAVDGLGASRGGAVAEAGAPGAGRAEMPLDLDSLAARVRKRCRILDADPSLRTPGPCAEQTPAGSRHS